MQSGTFPRGMLAASLPSRVAVLLLVAVLATLLPLPAGARMFLVPPEKDVELGEMTAQQIASNPKRYPILPQAEYAQGSMHLRRIVSSVLSSPKLR